jgi:SAM-dependent methyltransferase
MSHPKHTDVWDNGESYEAYVGRWSRPVGREFVAWLAVPAGSRWLDAGCGTGELTRAILEVADPVAVVGADPSASYAGFARQRTPDLRASFGVGDAQALPFESASFDSSVSGLVLNFVPDVARALSEFARVTRRGGIVGSYVWDYARKMDLMRYFWDAAVALDPAARDLDEGNRFPICNPEGLTAAFAGAGLRDIATRPIDVPTRFRDFDDYWSPFLGGQGSAPGYAMSLTEDHREALRERIRAALPTEAVGSINLIARAWAIKGRR